MEDAKIMNLIESRPYVYGWLWFQHLLRVLFFILGLVFLAHATFITIYDLVEQAAVHMMANQLTDKIGHRKEIFDLLNYFEFIEFKVISLSFAFSVSLFCMARYCKKIINRNRYILRLEEELKKTAINPSQKL